jgi:hypothetical protein
VISVFSVVNALSFKSPDHEIVLEIITTEDTGDTENREETMNGFESTPVGGSGPSVISFCSVTSVFSVVNALWLKLGDLGE